LEVLIVARRRLAERAAVCWLAMWEADLACSGVEASGDSKLMRAYERRGDGAHRRFLETVRRRYLRGLARLKRIIEERQREAAWRAGDAVQSSPTGQRSLSAPR
jgi:hypothetical protein